MTERACTVIALGGNAIVRNGDDGSIEQQSLRAHEALIEVVDLVKDGHSIVLTHGNGPVVGNIMLRGEAAADRVLPMPLYIANADSGGGVGYMLQQTMHNLLVEAGLSRSVVTVITQTVVDPADPAFRDPVKAIGPPMDEQEADAAAHVRNWTVRKQPDDSWKRVVASPLPIRLVEAQVIADLARTGAIVIAAGGGGIPVAEDETGLLRGVEAVVDKDWSGALLACALNAETYVVLMAAGGVYDRWGKPDARLLDSLTTTQVRALLEQGTLDGGSIAPKLAAAAYAAETCGCRSVLCAPGSLGQALRSRAGTHVYAG